MKKHWLCWLIGHNFFEIENCVPVTICCDRCGFQMWVPTPTPKEKKNG